MNFDATVRVDSLLSDFDVLEFASEVLVGTGVGEVELGIDELELGMFVYR